MAALANRELSAEELRAYCQANVSRYKVPRYVSIVGTYPITATGKVKKFELRDQLVRELASAESRREDLDAVAVQE